MPFPAKMAVCCFAALSCFVLMVILMRSLSGGSSDYRSLHPRLKASSSLHEDSQAVFTASTPLSANASAPAAAVRTVMFLGDSNTKGWLDAPFPSLVRGVRAMNFGVPNTCLTRSAAKHFVGHRPSFKEAMSPRDWTGIDAVISMFGTNDARDKIASAGLLEFAASLNDTVIDPILRRFADAQQQQPLQRRPKLLLLLTPPPFVARVQSSALLLQHREVVLSSSSSRQQRRMFTAQQRKYGILPDRLAAIADSIRASAAVSRPHLEKVSQVRLVDVHRSLSDEIARRNAVGAGAPFSRGRSKPANNSNAGRLSNESMLLFLEDGIHLSPVGALFVARLVERALEGV